MCVLGALKSFQNFIIGNKVKIFFDVTILFVHLLTELAQFYITWNLARRKTFLLGQSGNPRLFGHCYVLLIPRSYSKNLLRVFVVYLNRAIC